MTARTFVDTNVWVYAVDGADAAKQARAQAVLAAHDSDFVVSSQVLGEFYVTVTRKLERPVSEPDANRMLDQLRRLPVVAIGADHVIEAARGSQAWRISYWDALILAAAATAGCSRVLSEDLSDGATYGSVEVVNPFGPDRRVSERPEMAYGERNASVRRWDDDELLEALARYERASAEAGMTRNAVHSYWDYARRFLAWRTGDYSPRGVASSGRHVPRERVSAHDLAEQAGAYARALGAAGLSQAAIETYHRHAMFFVRWLDGSFRPGGRLQRSSG